MIMWQQWLTPSSLHIKEDMLMLCHHCHHHCAPMTMMMAQWHHPCHWNNNDNDACHYATTTTTTTATTTMLHDRMMSIAWERGKVCIIEEQSVFRTSNTIIERNAQTTTSEVLLGALWGPAKAWTGQKRSCIFRPLNGQVSEAFCCLHQKRFI